MFMTRAALKPSSLGALLAHAASNDGAHQLIWTLFPDPDAERDFLFRSTGENAFIIVSKRPPEDAHALWPLDTKVYTPDLKTGDRYGIVLRAHPPMSAKTSGARRGPRVDAVMHAKRPRAERSVPPPDTIAETAALDWLLRRGARLGAAFDADRCAAAGYQTNRINRKGADPIQFASVEYEGALTVQDADLFRSALIKGIGKAKAFGCGLLLIRPL